MTEIEVLFVAHIIQIAVVDNQAYDREQISALLGAYAASRRHAWQVHCFASGQAFLDTLTKADLMERFDSALWCGLVDFVTVYAKDDVRFTFKDGREIKA